MVLFIEFDHILDFFFAENGGGVRHIVVHEGAFFLSNASFFHREDHDT